MSTREQQKTKYWPTPKAYTALAEEHVADQWVPACGNSDCDGRCVRCAQTARDDAMIEAADARRKGDEYA